MSYEEAGFPPGVKHGNPREHTLCSLRCAPEEGVHAEVLYSEPGQPRPAPGKVGAMLPWGSARLIAVEDAPEAPDADFPGSEGLTQKTLFVYKLLSPPR